MNPLEQQINRAFESIIAANKRLSERIRKLENEPDITIIVKTTTGDQPNPISFMLVINEFDNNIKIYADGAWRTLTSW